MARPKKDIPAITAERMADLNVLEDLETEADAEAFWDARTRNKRPAQDIGVNAANIMMALEELGDYLTEPCSPVNPCANAANALRAFCAESKIDPTNLTLSKLIDAARDAHVLREYAWHRRMGSRLLNPRKQDSTAYAARRIRVRGGTKGHNFQAAYRQAENALDRHLPSGDD
jgi:hypothetical protein